MKRRSFLAGAAAGGVISTLDWLGWFRSFGIPGTAKELGIASAHAQAAADPKFLIYWFQEGGWDSYCMFSPLVSANDAATLTYTAVGLAWADTAAGRAHPTASASIETGYFMVFETSIAGYSGGLSRKAWRNQVTASSRQPCWPSTKPRLFCASASVGLSSTACT